MWSEFKKFAMKGNVIDLAVGVVIGGAFGKIVSSLVADLIMPLVGLLLGGINFSSLSYSCWRCTSLNTVYLFKRSWTFSLLPSLFLW